ncbi:hypothetical protein GUITHDRAFT_136290 [Guillardia theta CCMP2712]|uniref:Anaphase-promoting complex subunit 4 WD40 domain-containing protein n=1 Tax=Guillardia theta (strain CCMP2712) TaxID=905079 RepID=L1JKT5_GUITC|nr:hypothetical protein GUITHDRAFT_136290 [Guillardia theta CCMP2712]EKX49126.1 hypothetical protein GUITHDRAFT_136290 [Guillardia theta CCMP2712]|eukprot:XP_005836106.1 hypothetical protein GUITHDRAFT_136290 [Guillardia theta CCMP2712]
MNMWELITATTIVSYRPASPASKDAVATVGRDFFAVPLANKPTLHVFNWRKDQPHAKMSLPEKVCSIAANADGSYILAGAETGRVYLWEESFISCCAEDEEEGEEGEEGREQGGERGMVCGGALIRTWEAHYRSVTSIAFTDDSSFILTASEDALVYREKRRGNGIVGDVEDGRGEGEGGSERKRMDGTFEEGEG